MARLCSIPGTAVDQSIIHWIVRWFSEGAAHVVLVTHGNLPAWWRASPARQHLIVEVIARGGVITAYGDGDKTLTDPGESLSRAYTRRCPYTHWRSQMLMGHSQCVGTCGKVHVHYPPRPTVVELVPRTPSRFTDLADPVIDIDHACGQGLSGAENRETQDVFARGCDRLHAELTYPPPWHGELPIFGMSSPETSSILLPCLPDQMCSMLPGNRVWDGLSVQEKGVLLLNEC